jgi:hypothetical protein
MAHNEKMNLRKLLSILVALCVLFAPVVSNASVSVDIPMAHTQDHKADCHTVKDCHTSQSHDEMHHSGSKASHSCCAAFVGIVPDSNLVHAAQASDGLISFNPSLSLISRIEGLYRPPRQYS